MIKRYVLMMSVMVVAATIAGAATTIPYSEDFESGWSESGDPWSNTGGGVVTRSDSSGVTGSGVTITNKNLELAISDAASSQLWIQAYMKPAVMSVTPPSSISGVGGVFVNSNGHVFAWDNTGWTQITTSPVATDDWINFVLHVDCDADIYDVYIKSAASYGDVLTLVGSNLATRADIAAVTGVTIDSDLTSVIDEVAVSPSYTGVGDNNAFNTVGTYKFAAAESEFLIPYYAARYAASSNLNGAVGLSLLTGMRTSGAEQLAVFEPGTPGAWSYYSPETTGWAVDSGTAVGSIAINVETRLIADRDAGAVTYGFFDYDSAGLLAENGVLTAAGIAGYDSELDLAGSGAYTAFTWPMALDDVNDSTGPQSISWASAALSSGDRLYVASPGSSAYAEYWWDGSVWKYWASTATADVAAGSKFWVKKSGGNGTISY